MTLTASPPPFQRSLRNVIEGLTFDVYNYTCLGLFEMHKLMFSFQMCIRVLDEIHPLDRAFLSFFLKGNLSLEASERQKPDEWFPDQGWQDVLQLAELGGSKEDPEVGGFHPLSKLADEIELDMVAWQAYYELEAPEEAPMPSGFHESLTEFEKLLVLRCLRVDRVTVGITKFVISVMGERFVQPPVLDYSNIYKQSTEVTPIVFILSPGADPAFDVFRLGEDMGYKPGGKLKYMALGQGMGPKAQEFIETGAQRGLWIMLQVRHLWRMRHPLCI